MPNRLLEDCVPLCDRVILCGLVIVQCRLRIPFFTLGPSVQDTERCAFRSLTTTQTPALWTPTETQQVVPVCLHIHVPVHVHVHVLVPVRRLSSLTDLLGLS